MKFSLISRHVLSTFFHSIFFYIHDMIIPIILSQTFFQFFTNTIDHQLHKLNGFFILYFLYPSIFVSGFFLSLYISDKKYAYVFQNYGLNFFVLAVNLSHYHQRKFYMKYVYLFLYISNIYMLSYLYCHDYNSKHFDLFIALCPLPFINFLNIYSLYTYDLKTIHKINAYLFF